MSVPGDEFLVRLGQVLALRAVRTGRLSGGRAGLFSPLGPSSREITRSLSLWTRTSLYKHRTEGWLLA